MTLVGGMGLIYLKDFLSSYTDIWPLCLGTLFVLSVMTFRKGVFKEFPDRISKS